MTSLEASETNTPITRSTFEKTKKPPTNTDSIDARMRRTTNQIVTEKVLYRIYNLPTIARLNYLRNNLFRGFDNVKGFPIGDFRNRDVESSGGFIYPDWRDVLNVYLPSYLSLVDDAYKAVKMHTLTDDSGFRLAALAYNFGVLIHPYPDGNGQTFRMLSTSFLHELSPKTRSKWFPFTSPSTKYPLPHYAKVSFPDLPKGIEQNPVVRQLLKIQVLLNRDETVPHDPQSFPREKYPDLWNFLDQANDILGGNALNSTNIIGELAQRNRDSAREICGTPEEILFDSKDRLAQKGLHYYLAKMLSPTGKSAIVDYVATGKAENRKPEDSFCWDLFLLSSVETLTQMANILVPEEEHNKEVMARLAQKNQEPWWKKAHKKIRQR